MTDGCDGMLIATPQAFETPETLASLSRYYGGEVYAIGPLFATGAEAGTLEKSKSKDSDRIIAFMDGVLESRGPHSLIYVTSLIFTFINHSLMCHIHRSLWARTTGL